jgi:diguanylate cyclase (GGDEF)-like protein
MTAPAETTALVIDDDVHVHAAVDRALDSSQVGRVIHAYTPGDGIRLAIETGPDVIMLDINMPEIDGYKVCRAIKENAVTRDIPVVFLTVETKVDHIARALDCGGVDYVSKPFNDIELRARIRVALRGKQLIELLKEQARVDALTGLFNRAALDDALRAVASSHARTGHLASLLMLDIDHFKIVNDLYGHGVGDEVLRGVGASIRACCRPYDTACRYGGDEFAIIFGHTDEDGARSATARLLERVREISVQAGDASVGVSLSAGLVSADTGGNSFEPSELMKAADAALYRAKQEGRDRIVTESFVIRGEG